MARPRLRRLHRLSLRRSGKLKRQAQRPVEEALQRKKLGVARKRSIYLGRIAFKTFLHVRAKSEQDVLHLKVLTAAEVCILIDIVSYHDV